MQEFEDRLALAKKLTVLIFPRGTHESAQHFKQRLQAQAKSKRPILPQSQGEPDKGFKERCDMQPACARVIHPFDSKREDEKAYIRRLHANKERTALGFEPGDLDAIKAVLGEVKHEAAQHHEYEHVNAAEDLKTEMSESRKIHEEEEASAKELDKKAAEEEAKAREAQEEEERVAKRLEEMK